MQATFEINLSSRNLLLQFLENHSLENLNKSTLKEYEEIRNISERVRSASQEEKEGIIEIYSAIGDISKNILSQSSLSEELSLKIDELLKISDKLNQVASYYKT